MPVFHHKTRLVLSRVGALALLLSALSLSMPGWTQPDAQPGVVDTGTPASQPMQPTQPQAPSTLPSSLPTGPSDQDSLSNAINNLTATPIRPNSIPFKTAIPTYVVFPIVTHTAFNKAFSDLPVLLASTVANQMQQKAQANGQTIQVLNPIYSFDTLKSKGLDRLYQKMVRDYIEGGRPLEKDIYKLTDSLTTDTIRPTWVVFVEADFDTARSARPSGLEWLRYTVYDRYPRDPNMFITTRLKVFQLQDGMPVMYQNERHTSIKYGRVSYMTGSVFDNGAVYSSFKDKATTEASALLGVMPLGNPQSKVSTQAKVVPTQPATRTTPTVNTP
jgi:hypothetical protein